MGSVSLLPNADLPGADWADRHEVRAGSDRLTALDAARIALGGRPPGWIRALMKLRNALVGLVGLKPARIGADRQQVGAFPIVSQTPGKVVLGFDDWHLDFRIVVETTQSQGRTDVALSTLVNRKNWFGRAYIFLITPFHVLIVKRSLANLTRPGG